MFYRCINWMVKYLVYVYYNTEEFKAYFHKIFYIGPLITREGAIFKKEMGKVELKH